MPCRCDNQDAIISDSNNVCDAVNCFEKSEFEIEVKVGQQGTITLSLCKNCVSKFEDVDQSGG